MSHEANVSHIVILTAGADMDQLANGPGGIELGLAIRVSEGA
jgi:hypothetical protein